IIIDSGTESTEEVDRLAWEGINKLDDTFLGNVVGPEYTLANTNTVLSGWCPVEFFHTTITNERSIQSGEVISSNYNGNTSILLLVVHAREMHIDSIISDVHKCSIHHLIVDGILSGA
ncbi:hypothetical protein PO29_18525, partial [Vibrio anguillarum]